MMSGHAFAPQRIAVVRALQLGDMLVAVPALRALRAHFPQAEMTLIGLPWAAAFARRFSRYIDRFAVFPGWPGIREAPYDAKRTQRFLDEQRAYGYDLVIQMHGSGEASNPFALALGGTVTAGYVAANQPAALTLAAPYPSDQHEILRNVGLAWLVGCEGRSTALEFPLTATDHAEARSLLSSVDNSDTPLVGIHAGARVSARRWSAASFGAVADALARDWRARIVLTGGRDERAIVGTVERAMHAPALNLADKTSLGGLAAVMTHLDLFISNDTGVAHVAQAVGAPSVTIFGPADVRRWAPLTPERHRIVRVPVECSPCGYQDCPIDHRCLRQIPPELVLQAAEGLLVKGAIA